MSSYTMEECLKEWIEEIKKDQHFFETKFKVDENGFDIILPTGGDYGIEWCRIDSYEKLFDWLQHLREKTWFIQEPLYEDWFLIIVKRKLEENKEKTCSE